MEMVLCKKQKNKPSEISGYCVESLTPINMNNCFSCGKESTSQVETLACVQKTAVSGVKAGQNSSTTIIITFFFVKLSPQFFERMNHHYT